LTRSSISKRARATALLPQRTPKCVLACNAADWLAAQPRATVAMAAVIFEVSPSSIRRAQHLSAEQRQQVCELARPLVLPRPAPVPAVVPAGPPVAPIIMSVEQRLLELVAEIGGIDAALTALASAEHSRVAA
jgi:hypothetical protein